jgi:hypothetical protein
VELRELEEQVQVTMLMQVRVELVVHQVEQMQEQVELVVMVVL